jgi:F0F1-type ATP synthase assembly protein I
MRILLVTQLIAAALAGAILGLLEGWSVFSAIIYGASLGVLNTLLTKRGADKTLVAAVKKTTYGLVAMYSAFALRYAVAILGLLVGFRLLNLMAEPMIGGFILMILIQVLAPIWVRPEGKIRDT